MKLRNKKIKKAMSMVGLIILILMSFIAINTFSKYISEVDGHTKGSVAKWKFRVNGAEDCLGTFTLSQTASPETLVDEKIAPGTSGGFDIIIDASESETGVGYKVEFDNEASKPTNLKFMYNGVMIETLEGLENVLKGEIAANDPEKIKVLTIGWVWDFETGSNQSQINSSDMTDTSEGELIQNYTFDIVISGTQLMPV
ncbi:MAG: hypothetical protein Q4G05_00605 [Clostridia bacterium]|nr:hypothetical protein [Clostridia bacterium]